MSGNLKKPLPVFGIPHPLAKLTLPEGVVECELSFHSSAFATAMLSYRDGSRKEFYLGVFEDGHMEPYFKIEPQEEEGQSPVYIGIDRADGVDTSAYVTRRPDGTYEVLKVTQEKTPA